MGLEKYLLGDKVKTSMGEAIVLEENTYGNYLIILVDDKIVKANKYFKSDDKIVWENGEYYSSLHELMVSFSRLISE